MAAPLESKLPAPGSTKEKRRSLLPSPLTFRKSPAQKAVSPEPARKDGMPERGATWIPNEEPSVPPTDSLFTVGQRVCIAGVKPGILRYYGKTKFSDGLWCGIELDECDGTHDGTVEGFEYFSCKPGYGIFAPSQKVNVLSDKLSKLQQPKASGLKRLSKSRSRSPETSSPSRKIPKDQVEGVVASESAAHSTPQSPRFVSKLAKPKAKGITSSQSEGESLVHRGLVDSKATSDKPPSAQRPSRLPKQQTSGLPIKRSHSALEPGEVKKYHSSAIPKPGSKKEASGLQQPQTTATTSISLSDLKQARLESKSVSRSERQIKARSLSHDLAALEGQLPYPLGILDPKQKDAAHRSSNSSLCSKSSAGSLVSPIPTPLSKKNLVEFGGEAMSEPEDESDYLAGSNLSHASSLGLLPDTVLCDNSLVNSADLRHAAAGSQVGGEPKTESETECKETTEMMEKDLDNEISGISTPEIDMSSSTISGKDLCSSPDTDDAKPLGSSEENDKSTAAGENLATPATTSSESSPDSDITKIHTGQPTKPPQAVVQERRPSRDSSMDSSGAVDENRAGSKRNSINLMEEQYPKVMRTSVDLDEVDCSSMTASVEIAKTAVQQYAELMAAAEQERQVLAKHREAMAARRAARRNSGDRALSVDSDSDSEYMLHRSGSSGAVDTERSQLMSDLEAGHTKQERPVSMISTGSADTGIVADMPGTPRRRGERPVSLISTSSVDTGYQPDTDSEVGGTLTTNSPLADDSPTSGQRSQLEDELSPRSAAMSLDAAYHDTILKFQQATPKGKVRPTQLTSDSGVFSDASTLHGDSETEQGEADIDDLMVQQSLLEFGLERMLEAQMPGAAHNGGMRRGSPTGLELLSPGEEEQDTPGSSTEEDDMALHEGLQTPVSDIHVPMETIPEQDTPESPDIEMAASLQMKQSTTDSEELSVRSAVTPDLTAPTDDLMSEEVCSPTDTNKYDNLPTEPTTDQPDLRNPTESVTKDLEQHQEESVQDNKEAYEEEKDENKKEEELKMEDISPDVTEKTDLEKSQGDSEIDLSSGTDSDKKISAVIDEKADSLDSLDLNESQHIAAELAPKETEATLDRTETYSDAVLSCSETKDSDMNVYAETPISPEIITTKTNDTESESDKQTISTELESEKSEVLKDEAVSLSTQEEQTEVQGGKIDVSAALAKAQDAPISSTQDTITTSMETKDSTIQEVSLPETTKQDAILETLSRSCVQGLPPPIEPDLSLLEDSTASGSPESEVNQNVGAAWTDLGPPEVAVTPAEEFDSGMTAEGGMKRMDEDREQEQPVDECIEAQKGQQDQTAAQSGDLICIRDAIPADAIGTDNELTELAVEELILPAGATTVSSSVPQFLKEKEEDEFGNSSQMSEPAVEELILPTGAATVCSSVPQFLKEKEEDDIDNSREMSELAVEELILPSTATTVNSSVPQFLTEHKEDMTNATVDVKPEMDSQTTVANHDLVSSVTEQEITEKEKASKDVEEKDIVKEVKEEVPTEKMEEVPMVLQEDVKPEGELVPARIESVTEHDVLVETLEVTEGPVLRTSTPVSEVIEAHQCSSDEPEILSELALSETHSANTTFTEGETVPLVEIEIVSAEMSESTLKDHGAEEKGPKEKEGAVDEKKTKKNGTKVTKSTKIEDVAKADQKKTAKTKTTLRDTKSKLSTTSTTKTTAKNNEKTTLTNRVTKPNTTKTTTLKKTETDKKPTVSKVSPRISNLTKDPPKPKSKEDNTVVVNNAKVAKNNNNMKKADSAAGGDRKNSTTTIKRNPPPKSKWGNIMSQIDPHKNNKTSTATTKTVKDTKTGTGRTNLSTGSSSVNRSTTPRSTSGSTTTPRTAPGSAPTTPRTATGSATPRTGSATTSRSTTGSAPTTPRSPRDTTSRTTTTTTTARRASSANAAEAKTRTTSTSSTLRPTRPNSTNGSTGRIKQSPEPTRPSSRQSNASETSVLNTSRNGSLPGSRPTSASKPGNRQTASLRRERSPSVGSEASGSSQVSSHGSRTPRTKEATPEPARPRPGTTALKRRSIAEGMGASRVAAADKVEPRRSSIATSSRLSTRKEGSPSSLTDKKTSMLPTLAGEWMAQRLL